MLSKRGPLFYLVVVPSNNLQNITVQLNVRNYIWFVSRNTVIKIILYFVTDDASQDGNIMLIFEGKLVVEICFVWVTVDWYTTDVVSDFNWQQVSPMSPSATLIGRISFYFKSDSRRKQLE